MRRRTNSRFASPLATRITRQTTTHLRWRSHPLRGRIFCGKPVPTFPENAPMAEILILIPARMASTRLPGKPLADIAGVPMIVHVWRRAVAAEVGPVVVACGDREIADAIEAAGGRAVMTDPEHPTGSDRIHAAIAHLDPDGTFDAVINVQGDLPLLDPAAVRLAFAGLGDSDIDIATLAAVIEDA